MSLPAVALNLDDVFRCEKWACTLAVKHCLRRQREILQKNGETAGKKWVHQRAVHPYCNSGECRTGNEIAAAHPQFAPPERPAKPAPRLDIVRAVEERQPQQGEEMAKTVKRGDPKPCCGSRSSRHTAGCKAACDAAPKARRETKPAKTETKAPRRETGKRSRETGPDLAGLEVVQLLALIVAAQAELERREEDLKQQLDAIRLARTKP